MVCPLVRDSQGIRLMVQQTKRKPPHFQVETAHMSAPKAIKTTNAVPHHCNNLKQTHTPHKKAVHQ